MNTKQAILEEIAIPNHPGASGAGSQMYIGVSPEKLANYLLNLEERIAARNTAYANGVLDGRKEKDDLERRYREGALFANERNYLHAKQAGRKEAFEETLIHWNKSYNPRIQEFLKEKLENL